MMVFTSSTTLETKTSTKTRTVHKTEWTTATDASMSSSSDSESSSKNGSSSCNAPDGCQHDVMAFEETLCIFSNECEHDCDIANEVACKGMCYLSNDNNHPGPDCVANGHPRSGSDASALWESCCKRCECRLCYTQEGGYSWCDRNSTGRTAVISKWPDGFDYTIPSWPQDRTLPSRPTVDPTATPKL
jgi:hypothetical protein